MENLDAIRSDTRKTWEEPAIVLERSLEVAAQGAGPAGANPFGPPSGFIGPLGLSPSATPPGACG